MFRVMISTNDPNTGDTLAVPAEYLRRVQRASELLQQELGGLTAKFPIEALWRFRRKPDGSLALELDLQATTDGRTAGIIHCPIPIEQLGDDESTLRSLRHPLWALGTTLSGFVKQDLERLRKDLEAITAATGA